jgi:hypothetical protein
MQLPACWPVQRTMTAWREVTTVSMPPLQACTMRLLRLPSALVDCRRKRDKRVSPYTAVDWLCYNLVIEQGQLLHGVGPPDFCIRVGMVEGGETKGKCSKYAGLASNRVKTKKGT